VQYANVTFAHFTVTISWFSWEIRMMRCNIIFVTVEVYYYALCTEFRVNLPPHHVAMLSCDFCEIQKSKIMAELLLIPLKLIGFTWQLTIFRWQMLYRIRMMIYLVVVQYMKHRLQITQERFEYDLTTNSVKFMQQTASLLSAGDSSACK